MTESELLEQVKTRLGITGNYHDGLLQGYIEDVKEYLEDAGVQRVVVENQVSTGVIARGVADLWNYGAGDGKFSEVFYQRAIQLSFKHVDTTTDSNVRLVTHTREFITNSDNFTRFSIGIRVYNKATDTLSVYVNGMKLSDTEYVVINDEIELLNPVMAEQQIFIEVIHVEVGNV